MRAVQAKARPFTFCSDNLDIQTTCFHEERNADMTRTLYRNVILPAHLSYSSQLYTHVDLEHIQQSLQLLPDVRVNIVPHLPICQDKFVSLNLSVPPSQLSLS